MKLFLTILCLALPLVAQAFDCLPRPAGTGTALHVSQRDGMTALVWWCDKVTHWAPQTVVGTMGVAQMAETAQQLSSAADPLGLARQLMTQHAVPLDDALAAFRVEAYWDHARHKPADPVFAVATNGGRPTRPAYSIVDGARTTQQDGTATVGAPCQCRRLSFVEGRYVYCAFDATPRAAICARQ